MGGKKNIWLIFLVNVGTYTSPMDPMGYGRKKEHQLGRGQNEELQQFVSVNLVGPGSWNGGTRICGV